MPAMIDRGRAAPAESGAGPEIATVITSTPKISNYGLAASGRSGWPEAPTVPSSRLPVRAGWEFHGGYTGRKSDDTDRSFEHHSKQGSFELREERSSLIKEDAAAPGSGQPGHP